jgi:glucose/arabinose dehydrogenase
MNRNTLPRALALLIPLIAACSLMGPVPVEEPPTAPPAALATFTPAGLPPEAPMPSEPAALAPAPDAEHMPDPATALWTLAAAGLDQPVDLQHAGDDRLFLVEQPGRIRVLRGSELLPEPFLDLRDRVGARGSEQGLLGLAFHPSFADNGLFFVNYTDRSGDSVVARLQADPGADRADPARETVLLRVGQPFSNHNGGGMAFGPDGYLYIGLGDGGSAGDPQGNAQRLDTLLGKLLRLDVDAGEPYAVPPDNPFREGGARPEIWAYGLRNPWRFAFDPLRGDLFIADVGQNAWEEVNVLPAGAPGGANFGWNLREGTQPFAGGAAPAGALDPVAEYSHALGCSITGGVVVRDPALPAWSGVYLYGDYCSGRVWGLLRTGAGGWQAAELFATPHRISSFGAGADGGVYLVEHRGSVFRLAPAP